MPHTSINLSVMFSGRSIASVRGICLRFSSESVYLVTLLKCRVFECTSMFITSQQLLFYTFHWFSLENYISILKFWQIVYNSKLTRKPVGFMQSCCHPVRMTCGWRADDICHPQVKSCLKSCSRVICTSSECRLHIVCMSSARDFNPKNISS